MFGYVVANLDKLSAEQKALYRAAYCGLCKALGRQHGQYCRLTLTYDMAFLILLLSSIKDEEPMLVPMRCAMHPLKKQQSFTSTYTAYGADMNLILARAKMQDDWQDERKLLSLSQAKLLSRAADEAAGRRPRQQAAIADALKALSRMEQAGEPNPDLPANAFGSLMAALFQPEEDSPSAQGLAVFGFSLGRFIYLMDAVLDLKSDLEKERYNPLLAVPREGREQLLQLQMAQCTACFEALPVKRNKELLENILYSGVWTQYSQRLKKEATPSERPL